MLRIAGMLFLEGGPSKTKTLTDLYKIENHILLLHPPLEYKSIRVSSPKLPGRGTWTIRWSRRRRRPSRTNSRSIKKHSTKQCWTRRTRRLILLIGTHKRRISRPVIMRSFEYKTRVQRCSFAWSLVWKFCACAYLLKEGHSRSVGWCNGRWAVHQDPAVCKEDRQSCFEWQGVLGQLATGK